MQAKTNKQLNDYITRVNKHLTLKKKHYYSEVLDS